MAESWDELNKRAMPLSKQDVVDAIRMHERAGEWPKPADYIRMIAHYLCELDLAATEKAAAHAISQYERTVFVCYSSKVPPSECAERIFVQVADYMTLMRFRNSQNLKAI